MFFKKKTSTQMLQDLFVIDGPLTMDDRCT